MTRYDILCGRKPEKPVLPDFVGDRLREEFIHSATTTAGISDQMLSMHERDSASSSSLTVDFQTGEVRVNPDQPPSWPPFERIRL